MSFWNTTDTTIGNDVVYVNNTYKDSNGNNALSTISASNPTGYVPVDPDSTDPIIKNLKYAVQNDGKITYQYTETGLGSQGTSTSVRQFNSLQQLARAGITGYNSTTTDQIKNSIQGDLNTSFNQYNKDNPDSTIGPSTAPTPTPTPDDNQLQDDAVKNPSTIDPTNIEIGNVLGRTEFGEYYYPKELETSGADRIIFTLKEIKGSTINPTLTGQTIDRKSNLEELKGSVTLPIQPGISDSNSVDWSGSTLNALQAYAAGASMKFMKSDNASQLGNNISDILGKIANTIKNNREYGEALMIGLAQEAVGVQGLLSRASGAVLNPNLELLFNGPQLRPFNFTFRLSPREEKEADEVRSIIRFFKEAMSVKTTNSSVFLKSPFVFDIKYKAYGNDGKLVDHPSINRIKTCALLSCDVDYTPDGSYMTFNDSNRTMTSYQLSLRFSELEPIYSTDYTKDSGIPTDHIGY